MRHLILIVVLLLVSPLTSMATIITLEYAGSIDTLNDAVISSPISEDDYFKITLKYDSQYVPETGRVTLHSTTPSGRFEQGDQIEMRIDYYGKYFLPNGVYTESDSGDLLASMTFQDGNLISFYNQDDNMFLGGSLVDYGAGEHLATNDYSYGYNLNAGHISIFSDGDWPNNIANGSFSKVPEPPLAFFMFFAIAAVYKFKFSKNN